MIGTAIPREEGTLSGTATVREGNEARMKAREMYISSSEKDYEALGRLSLIVWQRLLVWAFGNIKELPWVFIFEGDTGVQCVGECGGVHDVGCRFNFP